MNDGERENREFLKMQREEFLDSMRISADVPSVWSLSEHTVEKRNARREEKARELCEILDIVFWRDWNSRKSFKTSLLNSSKKFKKTLDNLAGGKND